MQVVATYQGGSRFDITTGKHRVISDQPVDEGGQDAGMSPVELFVGSLAGCVGYFIGRFCERHAIPRDDLRIDAEWSTTEGPHRVGQIGLVIHLPHSVTPDLKDKLLKVAHGCTVHQSIAVTPRLMITLNVPDYEGGNG